MRAVTKVDSMPPESVVMQRITPRQASTFRNPLRALADGRLAVPIAFAYTLMLGLPSLATATQTFYIHFQPSPSNSAVGYTIHLGEQSGNYIFNVDIGSPPVNDNDIVYNATLDDSKDLYFAISSYDASGNSSAYSNEIRVAAATMVPAPPPPAPEPAPTPTPTPEPTPDPDPQPQPQPAPVPGIDGVRLGITTDVSGMISTILENGSLAELTLDSLASDGDLRPARCDLDGDGDGDLVIGFGSGSDGQVALLTIQDDAVVSVDSLQIGDAAYRAADGQTLPACGDIDGDGRAELVIGMGPAAEEVLQVLDDSASGFASFVWNGSSGGRLSVPVSSRIRNLGSALIPALGDIDGDGRDELVVGFATTGIREIAILDDGLAGFAGHPNVTPNLPLVRVATNTEVDNRGGGTRPALGDFDGDGLDEIAVGFGTNSDGWVAILEDAGVEDYDRHSTFLMIPSGRDAYRAGEGSTQPAFADIDGDGREELVVGFAGASQHELQIFDDLYASGIDLWFGGMGFVVSPDTTRRWIASPAR